MMLLLLFMSTLEGIKLPEFEKLIDIAISENSIYALDARARTLTQFSMTGKPLRVYGSKGMGPGEWLDPIRLRMTPEGTLLVCDIRKYSIFVFNKDCGLIEEVNLGKMCRDITTQGRDWFVVCYDTQSGTMVQKFTGTRHTPGVKFAPGLEPRLKLQGMQSGSIASVNGNIYFVRTFDPTVEVYNTSGKLLKKISPKGIDPNFLATIRTDRPNFWNDVPYRVTKLNVNESQLFLTVFDQKQEKALRYSFSFNTQTWKKQTSDHAIVRSSTGETFELKSEPEGYALAPIKEAGGKK